MNLAGIDLNLLVAFDALMQERNVTRAGKRIGMSQPAMSNALNRLRHLVKDDLFLRGPRGMRPTPRAVELAAPIHQALSQVEAALSPAAFDPATAASTFRFSMADYAASLILPPLAERLEETAPEVDIRVRPDTLTGPQLLDRNEIDFAIGYYADYPDRFRGVTLFEERYVCVMRRGHPLARKRRITLEEFVAAKHLLITLTGEATGFVDRMLSERGLSRRVAMTVNQFLVAPLVIQNSDMIITLALRTAKRFADVNKLHIVPLPLERAPIKLTLLWHEQLSRHPAHDWMRSLLVDICREI